MAGYVAYSVSEKWEGGRVTRAVGVGGARGVNKATEFIRGFAVADAPKDQGPLRASSTVREATVNSAEAWLIFDTPYAAVQHEEEDYHHEDGKAHYVSDNLEAHGAQAQAIIAKEIRVEIGLV